MNLLKELSGAYDARYETGNVATAFEIDLIFYVIQFKFCKSHSSTFFFKVAKDMEKEKDPQSSTNYEEPILLEQSIDSTGDSNTAVSASCSFSVSILIIYIFFVVVPLF